MRRQAQHLARRNSLPLGDGSEPGEFRLTEPGDALCAVAIYPFYLVDFLARRLHQIAKKSWFIDYIFHTRRH